MFFCCLFLLCQIVFKKFNCKILNYSFEEVLFAVINEYLIVTMYIKMVAINEMISNQFGLEFTKSPNCKVKNESVQIGTVAKNYR